MENITFESPFEKVWLTENPIELDTANMRLMIQCSRIVYSRLEELYRKYHSHDFYEIHYVIEGKLVVDFEEIGLVNVNKGEFLVCKPNIVHRTANVSPNTQKFVFGFYVESKRNFLTKAEENLLHSPVKVFESTNSMQLLVMIMLNCTRNYSHINNLILMNQLESFVLEVLNIYSDKDKSANSMIEITEERIVEQAKKFIVLNENRAISVEEVAKELGFSVRHLNRLTKLAIGQTLSEMIISARISYVKSLLKDTELTISEITERGGFADISTFTKFFKRYVGETPTAYRRKLE